MALVLASKPIKHPNYPNGDHYAVLDTDTGGVGYFTLDEIQQEIDEEGTQLWGNHVLAVKDTKSLTQMGTPIERTFMHRFEGLCTLVYYESSSKVVIEFESTGDLLLSRNTTFRAGQFSNPCRTRDFKQYRYALAENTVKSLDYANRICYAVFDTELNNAAYLDLNAIKEMIKNGVEFVGNNSLATKDIIEANKYGDKLVRHVKTEKRGLCSLVYYRSPTYVIVEFENTGNLVKTSYNSFISGSVTDSLSSSSNFVLAETEFESNNFEAYNISTSEFIVLSKSDISHYKELGCNFYNSKNIKYSSKYIGKIVNAFCEVDPILSMKVKILYKYSLPNYVSYCIVETQYGKLVKVGTVSVTKIFNGERDALYLDRSYFNNCLYYTLPELANLWRTTEKSIRGRLDYYNNSANFKFKLRQKDSFVYLFLKKDVELALSILSLSKDNLEYNHILFYDFLDVLSNKDKNVFHFNNYSWNMFRFNSNIEHIFLSCNKSYAKVILKTGAYFYIDSDNLSLVYKYKESLYINRNGYITVSKAKDEDRQSTMFLHSLILKEKSDFLIDHINGVPTDLRAYNLRYATRTENQLNAHAIGYRTMKYETKYKFISTLRMTDKGRVGFDTEVEVLSYLKGSSKNYMFNLLDRRDFCLDLLDNEIMHELSSDECYRRILNMLPLWYHLRYDFSTYYSRYNINAPVYNEDYFTDRTGCVVDKSGVRLIDLLLSKEVKSFRVKDIVKRDLFERYPYCLRCGTTDNLVFDHVIPLKLGGASTIDNGQTLCARCNIIKGTNSWDFRPESFNVPVEGLINDTEDSSYIV